MATMTKATERTEHEAVRAARERLKAIRCRQEELRATLAVTPREKSYLVGPIADSLNALAGEQRAAEVSLREAWRLHVSPGFVERYVDSAIARRREMYAAARVFYRIRALALEERTTLNREFQEARSGIPAESDWSNYSPPDVPTIPAAGDIDDCERRDLRALESWRETWCPSGNGV